MTTVKYTGKSKIFELTAKGHAGYAPEGEPDIVCSAVSILAYQLAQVVTDAFKLGKLRTKPKVVLNDGNVRIKCIPHKEYAHEIAYAFYYAFLGYSILVKNYPENVTIKCSDELKRN